MEADYDRKARESQVLSDIVVRWDRGLNQKHVVFFSYHNDARVMIGDELKLEYHGELHSQWEGIGTSRYPLPSPIPRSLSPVPELAPQVSYPPIILSLSLLLI